MEHWNTYIKEFVETRRLRRIRWIAVHLNTP
nr:MAG TPA: hypothetical protein [Caudoviricetes sp.]